MGNHSAQPIRQTSASSGILSNTSITAIIFLTWLLIYVPGLSNPGLLDDADSVHAEASREMLLNNDWVTLHVNGIRYLEKAPLMYWAVAGSFKFFGVGEWQVRLPLALSVLGMMWCAFLFGRRAFGNEGGLYAALIMGTAPGIYIFTRFVIPDVWVVVWLTASIYLFWIAYEQENPSRWVCWGLAVTVALNVLTKSLIGLAFPAMVIFVFLLITGELRKLGKLRLFSSAIVFLAVAAPWHILAAIRNPAEPSGPQKGFLWFYFWNEQFMRYLNKRVPHDYGKVPLLVFYGLLLLWIVPWCAFLFPARKEIPGRVSAWRAGLDERLRANLLFGTWAVLILAFFSFSSRQEYYSLPAVPALALLIAGWLERESNSAASSSERRAGRIASAVMLVIGVAVFIATMAILSPSKGFPAGTDIGDLLTQHPGQYKLSLGHMQDLTIESFGMFRPPLWVLSVSLLVGTTLNWILRRRGQALKANLALAAMMVGVLFAVYQGYVIFSPVISSKSLALQVRQQYKPGETIVIYRDYEFGSTLNFYTGIPVHMLNGRRADLWFGSFFPDAPHVFEDDESFARLWSGPARVYFFLEESYAEEALKGMDPKTVFVFARSGGKVILTNHPMQMGVATEPHSRLAPDPRRLLPGVRNPRSSHLNLLESTPLRGRDFLSDLKMTKIQRCMSFVRRAILVFVWGCLALVIAGVLPRKASCVARAQDLKNPLAGDPKEIQEGAFLFRGNCALCHGLNARGGSRGPDLTRGVWNHGGTDAEIFHTILTGIPGTLMPANDLTDLEAWEVVAYLRSLGRTAPKQVSGDRQAGEKLFQGDGNCWLCHMVNGKGGRVGPDLSSIGSRRSPEFLAEKIRDPNKNLAPGQMEPGKDWPYDAETITLVTEDGKSVRGVLRNEDTFSIQIMDLQEHLLSYSKRDLRSVTHEGKSVMPPYDEGLLGDLQLRDLVAYLDGLRAPSPEEKK